MSAAAPANLLRHKELLKLIAQQKQHGKRKKSAGLKRLSNNAPSKQPNKQSDRRPN
jgi:hypothetical protein